uniref:Arginine deiminase n=1 Tax=Strongyloides papillosus TaxID=174720 RepID=A0A0N5C518_STREA
MFRNKIVIEKYETMFFTNVKHYFQKLTKMNFTNDIITNETHYNNIVYIFESKTNEIVVSNFQKACESRNIRIKQFYSVNTHESIDEKLRNYLERTDISIVELELHKKYRINVCKTVEPGKIYHNYKIENVCYKMLPVVDKDNSLMFADSENYLHHFSPTKECRSFSHLGDVLEIFKEGESNLYEKSTNLFGRKLNESFKSMALGWLSHYFIK